MNSKVYKSCAVPLCVNTSLKTPNKVFVYVPHDKIVRNKWLNLARRDSTAIKTNSSIYFCEDHFNLPNDMDNYMEYHVMGSVSQVRMKPGCLPTKFQCQPDRIKRTSDTTKRSYMIKKQRRILIEECMNEVEGSSTTTKHLELEQTATGTSDCVSKNLGQPEDGSQVAPRTSQAKPIVSQKPSRVSQEKPIAPRVSREKPVFILKIAHVSQEQPIISQEAPCVSQEKPVIEESTEYEPDVMEEALVESDDTRSASSTYEDYDEAPEQKPELPVICENCNGSVVGARFACVSCSGRVVCGACVLGPAHPHCYVLRVPPGRPRGEVVAVLRAVRTALDISMFADQLAEPLVDYHDHREIKMETEVALEDQEVEVEPPAARDAGEELDDPLAGTSLGYTQVSSIKEEAIEEETEVDIQHIKTDDIEIDYNVESFDTDDNYDVISNPHISELVARIETEVDIQHIKTDDIEIDYNVESFDTDDNYDVISNPHISEMVAHIEHTVKVTDKGQNDTIISEPKHLIRVPRVPPKVNKSSSISVIGKPMIPSRNEIQLSASLLNPGLTRVAVEPSIVINPVLETTKKDAHTSDKTYKIISVIPQAGLQESSISGQTIKHNENTLQQIVSSPLSGRNVEVCKKTLKQPNIVLQRLEDCNVTNAARVVTKRKIASNAPTAPHKIGFKNLPG